MPKRRSRSDNAQKKKSKRLKTDPIGVSMAEVTQISIAPVESQMPSTKAPSAHTKLTDSEFEEWSDRVAEELVRNLNRNVLQEQREDQEKQRKAQK